MINTGYLFSKDSKRLFINTSLGCSANCSFCYLPSLKYSKGVSINNYKTAEELILELNNYKEFIPGKNGTLISFGCYSECFDDVNKKETLKLIKYFLNTGNQIQLSTKKYIDYHDFIEIKKLIKYQGQLAILISSSTITNWKIHEDKTTNPNLRFKSFNIISKLNIPMALYIKPVLPNITIEDVNEYIKIIKKYNIKHVIVGSIFNKQGTGDIPPFIEDNYLRTNTIKDEEIICQKLREYCHIYFKSTQFLKAIK